MDSVMNQTLEDNTPQPEEYPAFYEAYIRLVEGPNIIQKLIQQGQQLYGLISKLDSEQATYRYAEGKWSVKEVIGHLIDTERIMAYRALCIARGDKTSLPGFNQDEYVTEANFDQRSLHSLSSEYDTQRHSNISLFNSFDHGQLIRRGTANNSDISVRALIYIIAGHERHHLNILEEKYKLSL
jgi:uncharacterized damage-inducible protein DinB